MPNLEHVKVVKQGREAVLEWLKRHPDVRLNLGSANISRADLSSASLFGANLIHADVSSADLSDAILIGAYLSFANLRGADLSGAHLDGANLSGANLDGANLSGASLSRADLTDANLSGANLSRADLIRADVTRADLSSADLSSARVMATLFCDLDLSSVNGLDTIIHNGPSTVGVDTLYKSHGKIPEAFLRGCGVPGNLIEYLPSLIGGQQTIQFYSCFISYSHKDEEFCKRLHSRMRDEQLRVWFAPEHMKAGKKLHEQIDQAIRVHDKLLLVLSETSMESEWVATEIYHARQRERKESRQVLFPIRLVPFEQIRKWKCFDADSGKDMAREIREYFIPDFSDWKNHDQFEASFQRLLSDLNKAATDPQQDQPG